MHGKQTTQNNFVQAGGERCFVRLVVLIGLLFAALPQTSMADDDDQSFLAGLRSRRLFSVAIYFCEQALAEPTRSERERLELTLELARTYAQQALYSLPNARPAKWKAASAALNKYRDAHRRSPRVALLAIEAALLAGLEGEMLVQEAELGAHPEEARTQARERLRKASKLLEKTEQQINAIQPKQRNDEGFSERELAAMRDHLRMRYAGVWKNIALTYPPASDDRVNALTVAAEQFERLRQELSPNEAVARKARLEEAACKRLLGDLAAASRLLVNFNSAPVAIQLQARAEQVRILLAAKKLAEAVRVAEQSSASVASAELDLARLEAYLAEWKQDQLHNDERAAGARQQKIAATLQYIDQTHGAYWRRLAGTRVREIASSGGGASNVSLLERAADDLYLRKQLDEAIGAYRQAAVRAAELARPDQAFSLWKKAALVEYQRSRFFEAGRQLRKLAVQYPANKQASQTHLLAVYSLSRAAAKNDTAMSEYLAALEQHLELWSSSDTANQIRLWLGKVREHEKKYESAVVLYRQVAADGPEFEKAVAGLARCWRRQLQLSSSSNHREELSRRAKDAATFFEKILQPETGAGETLKRFAALSAADLLLRFTNDRFAAAETLLRNMPVAQKTRPAAEQKSAQIKLVWALAGQPAKREQASALLQSIDQPPLADVFALLEGLAGLQTAADASLARLILQCAALLEPRFAQLPEASRVRVMVHRAAAYRATGKSEAAMREYKQLIAENPQNAGIREAYAAFLFSGADASSRRAALTQWRILASKSRPRSDRWYRAKFNVARCYFALGEKERAAQFIRYLQAAPPGLEKTPLREQFLALLRRCEQ